MLRCGGFVDDKSTSNQTILLEVRFLSVPPVFDFDFLNITARLSH